eukprot:4727851-Lingulodinium_polyedra.AAC.1
MGGGSVGLRVPRCAEAKDKQVLFQFSSRVFRGWGQTKVIEDGLQKGGSEPRTVLNKNNMFKWQWPS